jgi:hypothetical protein
MAVTEQNSRKNKCAGVPTHEPMPLAMKIALGCRTSTADDTILEILSKSNS